MPFCHLGIVGYFFSLAEGAAIPGTAEADFEAVVVEETVKGTAGGAAVGFAAGAVLAGEAGTGAAPAAAGGLAAAGEVLEGAGTALLAMGAVELGEPVGEAMVLLGTLAEADGSTLLLDRLEVGIVGLLGVGAPEVMLEEAVVLDDDSIAPDWIVAELVVAELVDDNAAELLDDEASVAVAVAEADERLWIFRHAQARL